MTDQNKNQIFTSEEADFLFLVVHEKISELMCGNWDAVKDEIADMYALGAKILKSEQC